MAAAQKNTSLKSVVLWREHYSVFPLVSSSGSLNYSIQITKNNINHNFNHLQRWITPPVKGSDNENVGNSQLKLRVCHKWITADGAIARRRPDVETPEIPEPRSESTWCLVCLLNLSDLHFRQPLH